MLQILLRIWNRRMVIGPFFYSEEVSIPCEPPAAPIPAGPGAVPVVNDSAIFVK